MHVPVDLSSCWPCCNTWPVIMGFYLPNETTSWHQFINGFISLHLTTSPFHFLFKMLQWWLSLMVTAASPLDSHPPPPPPLLFSLWGRQHWRTQGISHHLREEANPLCPNFNWATNPPGLSKQWAPSAADNLACPPPYSLLSRAGLGPASVTVSNSGTAHLHRKCELLTKWLACSMCVLAATNVSQQTKWQTSRIVL